jgi:hypothetical protein
MSGFERWSYENLGQWHYVLGYFYILMAHNWPLLLASFLCLWWGWRLYRQPSRSRVCFFFGALLLGVTYEYHKHVAPTLHKSLDTVFRLQAGWLNGPAHALVGPAAKLMLFGAMAFFLGQGLWLKYRRAGGAAPALPPSAERRP